MAIQLQVSHSLKRLFSALSENLHREQAGVFTGRWIVTQTDGINNWIRYRLAEESGIAANLQFSKTNDIIYRIFQWIKPDAPSLIDRSSMTWMIYQLLREPEFINRFPDQAAYTAADPVKQIALAMKLADLFDQYQVYRHDLISKWNESIRKGEEIRDWQQYLWVSLKKMAGDRFIDRPQLAQQLKHAIQSAENRSLILQRMPQLHFFGMAIITPYYLDLFRELGAFMNISFYLLNPCPEHPWMDAVTEIQIARKRSRESLPVPEDYLMKGNDLLLQWGKILKESFYLLIEQDAFVNAYTVLEQPEVMQEPSSLLQKIQSDIYLNASSEIRSHITESDLNDQTLVINGCYTPVREVEVLYNFILQKLSDQSKENPFAARDIVVLVSDIDAYAPIIHAVFRHAPVKLPYTIADESVSGGNTIFSALQEILSIQLHTCKSEEILALLESPFIRKHFGLTDVDAVRTAVREASIFFGTSSVIQDAQRYQDSETWMVSWEYGLKKIMYGLCMSGEPDYYDGTDYLLPLDTAEGSDMEDRVRLLHFFQVLRGHLLDRRQDRTIAEWTNYLSRLLQEMILDPSVEEESDYARFIDLLEEWNLQSGESDGLISFEVFRYAFFSQLEQERRTRKFAGAGITFCSLVPMRSIPYRVVAMLGLNFDDFPRKEQTLSFNKMAEKGKERVGDRNVRENDKHLFLETLLSAEENFYISYLARSQKDGSVLPPSSLVDQLVDYVARGMKKDADYLRKEWITIHPLHGFSSAYDGVSKITYLNEQYYRSSIPVGTEETKTVEFDFSAVSISQLISFMENPPRLFLQKALHVFYHEEGELIPEHEPFMLDHYQRSPLKAALHEQVFYGSGMLTEEEQVNWLRRMKQAGKIPLAGMGKASMQTILDELAQFIEPFEQIVDGRTSSPEEIRMQIGPSVLSGKIDHVHGDRFIYVCNSSSRIKHLLRAWIQYLALIGSKKSVDFYFLFLKSKEIHVVSLDAGEINEEEAISILTEMMNGYCSGHSNWFYFFPEFAKIELQKIRLDYPRFMEWYEEAIENPREFRLSDSYLRKAVESGFLAEENFPLLQQQVLMFMLPLFEKFPLVFK